MLFRVVGSRGGARMYGGFRIEASSATFLHSEDRALQQGVVQTVVDVMCLWHTYKVGSWVMV